tara:strand:+ start:993 stop:2321 length:1329 start_codon:yes stop_codon:yes gene_type:complete
MNKKYSTLGFDKIYVINLKRRLDRKTKLIKENPHLDFTFIEAIDGKDLIQKELLEKNLVNTSFYDPTGMVTMGIFACALSHKKAWDQALDDGVENALFLEDDVIFTTPFIENFVFSPLYQDIYNEIEQYDWDLIHLGKKSQFQNGINVGKYLVIPRYNSNYNGAHAYVATKGMIQTLSSNYLPVKYAADVYLEQFINGHNIFTLKESIIRQTSDTTDPQNADSDTFYNEYRDGGGTIGISFDENGNVLNKKIAQYIKHPPDIVYQYTEIVLEKPKFGLQKFNGLNFFGLSKMLIHLSKHLDLNSKMIEINGHLGETTFYFGCSGLFSDIYVIDPLKGEDKFNIDNNLTWEDIKMGFHSNTQLYNNITHIKNTPDNVVDSFKDISFLYINNRKNEKIADIIESFLPKIKSKGYIGGDCLNDAPPKSVIFENGSWLIKKEDYTL